MGDPDRLGHGMEAGLFQEEGHFFCDLVEDAQAAGEDRGPDLHGARPCHDVLQGVAARPQSTYTDHGDVHLLADVVYGPHAYRPDRRYALTAGLTCDGRW